jgi:hypothetical protein
MHWEVLMSVPTWFNVLRATHAAYRNREDIKKEIGEAFNQAVEGVRTGYVSYEKQIEFEKTNPKPSIRIPLWKGCISIFAPLIALQILGGILPEQADNWLTQSFVWFLIAWLAGSTFTLVYMNRSSRAALREWERRKEEHVAGR